MRSLLLQLLLLTVATCDLTALPTEAKLATDVQIPLLAEGRQIGAMKLAAGSMVMIHSVTSDGVMVSRGDGVPFKVAKEAIVAESLAAALATPTPGPTVTATPRPLPSQVPSKVPPPEAAGEMQLPPLTSTSDSPGPGRRFLVTTPEYQGTKVHHQVYLPSDWTPDWKAKHRSWPVIVEYTGNAYAPTGSTGNVEDAALGYGLSAGNCIWVVLPFVAEDHRSNCGMWWGDEEATVDYAKLNVPRLCAEYGGDPKKVVICGFSRGAIAVNYIGLHDDAIAKLWCGFMSHDHYDGAMAWPGTAWGFPLEEYRKNALARLERLQGRPALVSQAEELGGAGMTKLLYLKENVKKGAYTFITVPIQKIFPQIPNPLFKATHTDCWMFRDSGERRLAREWLDRVVNGKSDTDPTGVITLLAPWAEIHGGGLVCNAEQRTLQNWWEKDDASWSFTVAKPGRYSVDVTYSCKQGEGECEYLVEVGDQKLSAKTTPTQDWSESRTDHLGVVTLTTPGPGVLTLRLKSMSGKDALHLRSVVLRPTP